MSTIGEDAIFEVSDKWSCLSQFEKFKRFSGVHWDRAMDASIILYRPKGMVISYKEVQNTNMVFVVLSGLIKVYCTSTNGRVICLCHLKSGAICPISIGAVMGKEIGEASCLAESDLTLLGIPKNCFNELMGLDSLFRDLVVAEMLRFSDSMVNLVKQVSFTKLPSRVASYLICLADIYENDVIPYTHQAFANELGTTREVMSRLLKEFESLGYISMERKAVKILQRSELIRYSDKRES